MAYKGPDLKHLEEYVNDEDLMISLEPGKSANEITTTTAHSLVTADNAGHRLSMVIDIQRFSSAHTLFKVTSLVLGFINHLCGMTHREQSQTQLREFERARLLWFKDCQTHLKGTNQHNFAKKHLGLYRDDSGV